jgi:hypothetical protein
VTAQLIEVVGQEHLWADQYDRELNDIFLIQSDIARHVANGLQISLLSTDANRIERKETENVQAHVAYLKGKSFYAKEVRKLSKRLKKSLSGQ